MPPRKPTNMSSNFENMSLNDEQHLAYGEQGSAILSKKEEAWLRRWIQAKRLLEAQGIMLKSWRVGEDVKDDVLALVQKAAKAEQAEERGRGKERAS